MAFTPRFDPRSAVPWGHYSLHNPHLPGSYAQEALVYSFPFGTLGLVRRYAGTMPHVTFAGYVPRIFVLFYESDRICVMTGIFFPDVKCGV